MSDIEKALTTVLTSFMGGIDDECKSIYKKLASEKGVTNAFNAAKKYNNEEFYIYLIYPFSNLLNGLLSEVTGSHEAQFFLKHGEFTQRHIEKLIVQFEGSACSCDKSRTIMKRLIRYHMTGEEIKFNYDGEYTYHLPKRIFKTHDEIINFTNSLADLYYGKYEKYIRQIGLILQKMKSDSDEKIN